MKQSNAKYYLLYPIFFISGFSALLYQVVWQRWLVFYIGISSLSISLIVSAFMAGLGLGYLLGGYIADRTKTMNAIIFFILAELGIGIFAFFSKTIIYDLLYEKSVISSNGVFQTYFILFLVLLIPTLLMGLSLPLLSKSTRLDDIKKQSQYIGNLYFVNTLGAAFGAIVSGVFLIRWIGFQNTVLLGASFNFLCFVLGFYISKSNSLDTNQLEKVVTNASFSWDKKFSFWAFQYFISGFMAICFEILWFRILDVTIKSMAMTFSIVLGIYLFSMAIGSTVGVRFVKKSKANLLKTYLMGQYAIYVYSLISILALIYLSNNLGSLGYLFQYFENYEMSFDPKLLLTVYVGLPILLMSIPTFIMGFNFSVSQAAIQDDFSQIGRKIGLLQFINIVGCTLGSWMITLLGFNLFGTATTIQAISVIGFVYIFLLKKNKLQSNLSTLILSSLLFVLIYIFPNNHNFWKSFLGIKTQGQVLMAEDDTALSSIKMGIGHYSEDIVFINGLGQSLLPYKKDSIHAALGSIPSLIHPSPKNIAIIGLGSGGTLYAMSGNPVTEKINCFEVIKNQKDVLLEYADLKKDSSIINNLSNPKVQLIIQDGRYHIQNNDLKYDIIQADALRPRSPYAGNIYSKEYFLALKKKLKPRGIMASWKPSERVADTFLTVFPYVYEIGDFILLGSNEPFEVSKKQFEIQLQNSFTKNHFDKANIDINRATNAIMQKIEVLQFGKIKKENDINTDMFPKDEFNAFNLILEKFRK
jgi:spermidine synthase